MIVQIKKIALCCVLLTVFSTKGNAQQTTILEADSVLKIEADSSTLKGVIPLKKVGNIDKQEVNPAILVFKPNPTRAVIYSAVFPGLGQIYNKKYWKLPFIYGGFLGLTYAVSWNGGYLSDYSEAYKAVMSENPLSEENIPKWEMYLMHGETTQGMTAEGVKTRFSNSFKRKKDYYRRNRDLSIIGMVALYGICIIDAYVDAQLFDFDISPDISLRVEPTIMNSTNTKLLANQNALGVQCSFKF